MAAGCSARRPLTVSPRPSVEIAAGVHVMTSSRYTTTTTIVCRGGGALLVDPAWTVTERDGIVDWLRERSLHVVAGFSTHAHHDHLLWHPGFGDVPRWASADTVRCAHEWRDELTTAMGDDLPAGWPNPIDGIRPTTSAQLDPFGEVADAVALGIASVELVVHDGHAPGHTALLLADQGVLVAGDMLSDIELPLPFHPDDLPAYLAALDALAPAVARATALVPGHGHPTDRPVERLDADRRYLDALLGGSDPDDPRRALPGMDAAHAHNVELARALTT